MGRSQGIDDGLTLTNGGSTEGHAKILGKNSHVTTVCDNMSSLA